MTAIELIKSRRTIRRFKPDIIPEDIISEIFEAAVWAPSHRNSQPWEFAVIGVQTRGKLLGLYRSTMEKVLAEHPDLPEPARKGIQSLMEDFGGAPFMVAVMSKPPQDPLENIENPMTAAVAVQNMCLAAWDRSVGSVWLSIGGASPAREILQVKEGYQVVSVLALGYPEMVPPGPPRDSFENRITRLP
ncbi:MAG: nitroreductase [Candidatus Saccharibacteria bacterium]